MNRYTSIKAKPSFKSNETIEIDEIETEVSIEYDVVFGEIEINKITDLATGEAICPDLLDELTSDKIYAKLFEDAMNLMAEKEKSFYTLEY